MPGDAMMDHVYVYIHDFRTSGVVRDALTCARRFSRDRPTTLIAGYGNGLLRAEAEQGPFRLVILAERPGRAPRFAGVPRLRRWLRKQPPGVLLSMGVHGHPTVFLAVQGLRHIRRIYRISNEVAGAVKGQGRLRSWWLDRLKRDATRLILVGGAMAAHAIFAKSVASGHTIAIPSGVDRATARALARAPSPHPWLDEGIPVIIAIGRLRPQKNLELLIEAVAIAGRRQRLRLIILGAGTPEEQARMLTLAGAFADDFLLGGETDNVFAWLVRADVFALPSRWEGSSLALLEAMAVGTPVIASRLAGDAAQVLDEGRYGLLFDGVDAPALADALLRQLSETAVLPADRTDAYALTHIADRYAAVVADVLAVRGEGRERSQRAVAGQRRAG